jgi:hypothetical protein
MIFLCFLNLSHNVRSCKHWISRFCCIVSNFFLFLTRRITQQIIALKSIKSQPTFRMNISPPYAKQDSLAAVKLEATC